MMKTQVLYPLILLVMLSTVGRVGAQTPPPPPTPTLAAFAIPTATATPTLPPPTATPLPDINQFLRPEHDATARILLAVRNDLELLTGATLGTPPAGWSGSYNVDDPQMPLLVRLDLETLVGAFSNDRPLGWFGVNPTTPYALARDVRHDLELLADLLIAPGVRPPFWIGDDPLMRCARSTQNLITLLGRQEVFTPLTAAGSGNYCEEVERELNVFVETTLLTGNFILSGQTPTETPVPPPPLSVVTDAAAYLDRAAGEGAGVIPSGTTFEALARSYAPFSRMVLIAGEGFVLFVDYQDTTLDALAFEALRDVDTFSFTPSCSSAWCQ
ncbi:MAG: hypothetical protein ACOYLB_09080 [Phototrophicaceae bacterium]